MLHVLARLYYMLSGDAAMSTVAPFDCHELLQVCYDCALVGQPSGKDLQELKTYCVELVQLIIFGITHKCQQFVKDFCQCLVDEIKRVHENNRPSPAVNPVPNSYNPSSGTAYFFTPSGVQCANYQDMKSAQMTKKKMPTSMIFQKWTKLAGRCSPGCPEVVLDIFFYGSAQYMGIVMVSIQFQVVRVEKTHSALCLNIVKPCQSIYIMTLHVSSLSTASIGSQNYSNLPDSGMICSISQDIYVRSISNLIEYLAKKELTLKSLSRLTHFCNASSIQDHICHRITSLSFCSFSCI